MKIEEENEKKEQSLEEALKKLEEIVEKMDTQDLPLEESFSLYQEGMKLIELCHGKIEKVEQELTVVNEERGLE